MTVWEQSSQRPEWDGPKADRLLTDECYEERTSKNGFRPIRAVLLCAAER